MVWRVWLLVMVVLFGCAKRAYEPSVVYDAAPPPPPAPPTEAYASMNSMGDMASFGGMELDGLAAPEPAPVAAAAPASRAASGASTGRSADRKESAAASTRATSTATSTSSGPAKGADTTASQNPKGPPAKSEAPARMIHYNGWARIQVSRPEDLTREVGRMAEQLGGLVESLTPERVTVRVPVDQFDAAFKAFLALGEVVSKSVTANDVTDQFLAIDLRLATAKMSRDRLVALLAKAQTEQEKLQLLAQIRRLSEQIDVMESQLRTLSSLASLSRITIEAQARPAFTQTSRQDDPYGLGWIPQLSPFNRAVASGGDLLKIDVPTGFVALDDKEHFVAESADGARIWTGRLDNEPRGDSEFWAAALSERLGPEFQSVERQEVGGYMLLRLVSETADAYRYLIAVRASGDHLDLIEVYYPGPTQEARYGDAVLTAIRGGQG